MRKTTTRFLFVGFMLFIVGGVALLNSMNTMDTVSAIPPRPTLDGIDQQVLDELGITLSVPSRAAAVDRNRAEQTALDRLPGATIRQSVLADVDDLHLTPQVRGRLAWAMSLNAPDDAVPSSGGPPGSSNNLTREFVLVLIDAQTGEFMSGATGGKVQS